MAIRRLSPTTNDIGSDVSPRMSATFQRTRRVKRRILVVALLDYVGVFHVHQRESSRIMSVFQAHQIALIGHPAYSSSIEGSGRVTQQADLEEAAPLTSWRATQQPDLKEAVQPKPSEKRVAATAHQQFWNGLFSKRPGLQPPLLSPCCLHSRLQKHHQPRRAQLQRYRGKARCLGSLLLSTITPPSSHG
ncbi:hypothetical protein BDV95DRAFT_218674 [Massariosphaeria phaeospora]|uniref:Uncharacterized protein n=1 Tax=Massariosphaeria phaeospora TaxID=100035 RepID=A0A7C8IH24_9PLEO|nr:hypothetical protein BDV95DRAFT_218674 [Massariosphaeria phaeospora]